MSCLLDQEIFTCCICNKEFSHVDGTWLPIGETEYESSENIIDLTNILRKPEVITSEKFTCYDCL